MRFFQTNLFKSSNAGRNKPRRQSTLQVEGMEKLQLLSSLVPGGIVSGSISKAAEVDSWTFKGKANDKVELMTTSLQKDTGFSAVADVYSPSGGLIKSFSAQNNATLVLPSNGTYTVKIHDSHSSKRGSYTIGLEGINPISPNPVALSPGGIVSGSINAPIQKDQWTFQGSTNDMIELMSTSLQTDTGYTAVVDLYSPSGGLLKTFTPQYNLAYTLPMSGTYMVQVHDSHYTKRGSYTIGLEMINPTSPDARSLTPGSTTSGSINSEIQKDEWTFTGTTNQVVNIVSTSLATDTGFTAVFDVYSPTGGKLRTFTGGSRFSYTLPSSGTYMIQVHDSHHSKRGSYTIQI